MRIYEQAQDVTPSSADNCLSNIIAEPQFTSNWFSHNLGTWNKYKPFFSNKPNMHCLEIGSFEGRSTIYIAENYCNGLESAVDALDTWEGSVEHNNIQKNELYSIIKFFVL